MNEGLLALQDAVRKRDDDATVTVLVAADGDNDDGPVLGVVVETTEDLSGLEPWPVRFERWWATHVPALLDADMLHNEARAPPPTPHVKVVQHVFMANLFFVGVALTSGVAFYYWRLARAALVALVSVCGALFAVLHVALVVRRTTVRYGWWEAGFVAMALAGGVVVGCTAALARNVAPFEWLATLWAQSVMVIMYALWAPRTVASNVGALAMLMAGATLCVWGLAIVAAFEVHDWVASLVVLALACAALFYQLRWVRHAADAKYAVSWRHLVVATMEFYGWPVILLQRAIASAHH